MLISEVRPRLSAYLSTIGRDLGCEVFRVGGEADHVHMAVDLGRTMTVADLVKKVKQTSSVWLKEQDGVTSKFEWQAGYGAFSIGESQLQSLVEYIDRQDEHHRKKSFQEEYREMLAKYRIECDEKYLWD
jgi:REP element-mobilizing transposase RayT